MTGAPYEMNFAEGKRRTGRCDKKHLMVTGLSIQICHLDVSGIYIAIGWYHGGSGVSIPIARGSWPISHAWMDEEDRAAMWTPINGYELAPFPSQRMSTLNLIRIEMLNLGADSLAAEYTWLDVLCLRQVGGRREDLRVEEWKLDVPTIGWVYQREEVVCYLSGLGRPLTLKEGDLDSDRSCV